MKYRFTPEQPLTVKILKQWKFCKISKKKKKENAVIQNQTRSGDISSFFTFF